MVISGALEKLTRKSIDGVVSLDDLREEIAKRDMKFDAFPLILEKMLKDGDLFIPRNGYVKMVLT